MPKISTLFGRDTTRRNGYALLLDKQGVIVWQEKGFSNAQTLAELFNDTEALLK